MKSPNTPIFFQIGFNKCATTALFELFKASPSTQCIHSGGRAWRLKGHPSVCAQHPQKTIDMNIKAGRPPLATLMDFNAFFDMEMNADDHRIENYKQYEIFAETYPAAKFLLNTRPKADWIRSRLRHQDGRYLARAQTRLGLDTEGVIAHWAEEFDTHCNAVRSFFATQPERLLEFDVFEDDIERLIDFAAPDFELDKKHWRQVRVTKVVAKKKGWSDERAALKASDIEQLIA